MKNIIFTILFLSLSFIGSTQNKYKDRTVLGTYILGVDSTKSVTNKMLEVCGNYVLEYDFLPNTDDLYTLTYHLPNFVTVSVLVLNDTLFGVKYSPYDIQREFDNLYNNFKFGNISEEKYNKKLARLNHMNPTKEYDFYFKKLNNGYKVVYDLQEWENDFIVIQYNGENDFFYHYDKGLLIKHPQYKDF